jgi:hypothetical protein
MFDLWDVVLTLLAGVPAFLLARAYRRLPLDTQLRWKRPWLLGWLTFAGLALAVWLKLLFDYRP